MGDGFLKIAITLPDFYKGEAAEIARLLEDGYDYVHIRKPSGSRDEVRRLIEDIPYSYRCRLRLHGHFTLLDDFNLAGVHLNSRCPEAPQNARTLTRSCHSLEELRDLDRYEYVTLSPIFDSISKPGYKSAFSEEDLLGALPSGKVIALGGVTPDKFPQLQTLGFAGAAMMGAAFKKINRE